MRQFAINGATTVRAVKPETNIRFLRERAWKSTQCRRAFGLPLNPHMLRVLVIQGGKRDRQPRRASDNAA